VIETLMSRELRIVLGGVQQVTVSPRLTVR